MLKRTTFLAMAFWFCLTGLTLAAYHPSEIDAATAIKTYAEMYAFGDSEKRDKIISPQEMHGRMTARFIVNLTEIFKDYPLSDETFAQIQSSCLKKFQQNINLQTRQKSESVVSVTAAQIDYPAVAEMAAKDSELQNLKAEVQENSAAIKADEKFQSRAAEIICNFIEKIPAGKIRTLEVNCKLEGGNWIPTDNGKALSDFLVADIKPDFFPINANVEEKPPVIETQPIYAANDKWLIYWYVCGTDLESGEGNLLGGAASRDIAEIEAVKLPGNVKIIMQLGGAKEWQDKRFNSHSLGRWLYDSAGMRLLENAPDANMGDEKTLEDFIAFGENYNANNFQADHKIFIFWDHGGNNMRGICFDDYNSNIGVRYSRNQTAYLPNEKPNRQNLTLNDIQTAFKNKSASKFEIIGFDTCLGANYEYANAIADFANYMVASEAGEPNCGWYYTNWLNDLSKNPAIDARDLSIKICDSFMYGVKISDRNTGRQENLTATLSAFDLSKMPQLRSAYENYGREALEKFNQNSSFGASLRRAAVNAQKYSTTHVDLEGLARNTGDIFSSSKNLSNAIQNARVYKNHGADDKGGGLGAYFLYSGKIPQSYLEQNAIPKNMTQLFSRIENDYSYRWGAAAEGKSAPENLQAELDAVNQYIAAAQAMSANVQTKLSDKGGLITARVPKQYMPYISNVKGTLIRARTANRRDNGKKIPVFFHLGSNASLNVNWKIGEIEDKFDGTWAKLNGHVIAMYQYAANPKFDANHKIIGGYNIYNAPILVNGKNFYWLKVAYDYSSKKYSIIGLESIIQNDSAVAGRENISLNEGDTIQAWAIGTFYEENPAGDSHSVLVKEDFLPMEAPFKITGELKIKSEILENGMYGYFFNFEDMHGLEFDSGLVKFSIYNGNINPDDHVISNESYNPNLHVSNDGNTHATLPYDLESEANSVIAEIETAENRK